jgi:ribosomal protein L12E/L44/L45/RPP1/RPP2
VNEERRQILQMLAENKITAEEAERLLDAVGAEPSEPGPGAPLRPKAKPKYLRVIVNSEDGAMSGGSSRINVRVPLQLLRAGVRLTSLLPPVAITRANAELDKAGVPIDLAELKPKDIEALVDHLDELTVDIDDPFSKVQVFCE